MSRGSLKESIIHYGFMSLYQLLYNRSSMKRYCNPAPLNDSASNLVVVDKDKFGQLYYKHVFNVQVLFNIIVC